MVIENLIGKVLVFIGGDKELETDFWKLGTKMRVEFINKNSDPACICKDSIMASNRIDQFEIANEYKEYELINLERVN